MASAASSSSSRMSCFQCQDSTFNPANSRNGWRLRSGDFAPLCPRCACLYDDGRFCETFHSNDDGWRDCGSCGKLVHCGCIVSFGTHLLLDFGGVICMECSRLNFLLILSAADLKLARLIIPKRCAENFFPDISGLHGLRIKIQDIDGNEWEFHYLDAGSRVYVLEGLRDYMISNKCQSGDTVTFYRVEPGGKVVMGLRKQL
ncbi:hypothetical protein SASPL_114778 [Salvia splendens]|uniref:TF-B3 domain-containing protein n=1 Tax=Salvia splendens TaxID=180675 RepID=A0A8X9A1I2_SALSN|nr:hypothetical protein SASPL_114778 [Salvia splendens]